MFSTQLTTHVGKDGILNLKVPLGVHDQDVEIVVVVNLKTAFKTDHVKSADDLKSIIGAWQGEKLERCPQGDYETRKEFK
ncbi:hypothetical protein WDW89_16320 [Deltaproteobacteria bacterium TL4]